ncbi:MAG: transposase [Flavobacteriales bacterium]|nr:transposase [Flavobacteriales bacterium]
MYGLGLASDISAHMREQVETNDADRRRDRHGDRELRRWQARPLEPITPSWLDAAFFKSSTRARAAARCIPCWAWTSMGTRTCWAYVEESEGAALAGCAQRPEAARGAGHPIACTDNLKGFDDAIEAVFPTSVQGCIVHRSQHATPCGLQESRTCWPTSPFTRPPTSRPLLALEAFAAKWEERYPRAVQSWTNNWPRLSTFLGYPEPLRKLIHHQHHRGLPRPIAQGHQDQAGLRWRLAVLKLIFLVQQRIARDKWQRPCSTGGPYTDHRDPLHRPDPPINSNEQVVSLPRTPR